MSRSVARPRFVSGCIWDNTLLTSSARKNGYKAEKGYDEDPGEVAHEVGAESKTIHEIHEIGKTIFSCPFAWFRGSIVSNPSGTIVAEPRSGKSRIVNSRWKKQPAKSKQQSGQLVTIPLEASRATGSLWLLAR